MVVFIGTTGTAQPVVEKPSASIKTNFKDSLEVTTHFGLLIIGTESADVLSACKYQSSNSIFRIMSSFEYSNAKVLCAEKVCTFIYFKNNLLKTLSNEVMCLV